MKILVLEVSALHLGYLGCYGNDWVATPALDRLAAEGIVFDQHFADQPEPIGTGVWHERSAVTARYRFPGTPSAAVADGFMRQQTQATLDRFAAKIAPVLARPDRAIVWLDGPSLAPPWDLDADLLASYADEPLPTPPLGLVELDADDLARLQETYAAVVTCFDAQLERLVEQLRDSGRLDDLLLCVTARCGLPLGEHGLVGLDRPWLHDELVHIPLLLRLPGAAEAGLRIPALTQPTDLLPTFREFLGIDPGETHGHSLWPLIRGEAEQVRPYAVSALRVADGEEWLLRTPDRALLLPIPLGEDVPERRPQLYVKPDDRWEANDLAQRAEDEVAGLEQTLRTFATAIRARGPLRAPPLPQEEIEVAEEAS